MTKIRPHDVSFRRHFVTTFRQPAGLKLTAKMRVLLSRPTAVL